MQDNPAAVVGLLESYDRLLKVALATPGFDMSMQAFEDAFVMTEIFLEAEDSSSAVETVAILPSLVANNINTPSELDLSATRLERLCVVILVGCRWSTTDCTNVHGLVL